MENKKFLGKKRNKKELHEDSNDKKLCANFGKIKFIVNKTYHIQIFVDDKKDQECEFSFDLPDNVNKDTIESNIKEYMKDNSFPYVLDHIDDVSKNGEKCYKAFVFDSLISNNIAASKKNYLGNWKSFLFNDNVNNYDSNIQKIIIEKLSTYSASDDSDDTSSKINVKNADVHNENCKLIIRRIKFFKSILNTIRRLNGDLNCTTLNHQVIIVLRIINLFCKVHGNYQIELCPPWLNDSWDVQDDNYKGNKLKKINTKLNNKETEVGQHSTLENKEEKAKQEPTKVTYTCQCKGKDFFIASKGSKSTYFDIENKLAKLMSKDKQRRLQEILKLIPQNLKLNKDDKLQESLDNILGKISDNSEFQKLIDQVNKIKNINKMKEEELKTLESDIKTVIQLNKDQITFNDKVEINEKLIKDLIDNLNSALQKQAGAKGLKTTFSKKFLEYGIKDEDIKVALEVTGSLWLIIFVAESYRELTLKIQSASYGHIAKTFDEDKG